MPPELPNARVDPPPWRERARRSTAYGKKLAVAAIVLGAAWWFWRAQRTPD